MKYAELMYAIREFDPYNTHTNSVWYETYQYEIRGFRDEFCDYALNFLILDSSG
ncbi:hypothetical protein Hdeb2414_s0008g00267351 [Helianthus debilis subsp. tardiflorus]